jgi:hypothetical protein
LTLDVGCGLRKLGRINVDVNREVEPNIVCSVNNLPFRDNLFSKVFCYHVLEHRGVKPPIAINELLRVSKNLVEIQIPHWLGPTAKARNKDHVNFEIMHRSFWNRLKPIFVVTDFVYLWFFPFLVRPNNLTITLKKALSWK